MAKVIKSTHPIKQYATGGVVSASRAFDDQSATTVAQDKQRDKRLLAEEESELRKGYAQTPASMRSKKSLDYEIAYRRKLGPDQRRK